MKKITTLFIATILSVSAFAIGHVVTITSTNSTCNGSCDGTAASTVTGGVGPFGYSWSPSGGAGNNASNLCAGTYTLTVIDSSDMSTSAANMTINEPMPIVPTIGGGASVCAGSCVSLLGNVTGGTPAYTYLWLPGGITVASPLICPTSATSYTLMVTDVNGCTGTATTTVNVDSVPVGSSTSIVICNGASSNLQLQSTVSGTLFTWTSSVTLGSVIGNGSCSSGCSSTIADILTNTSSTHGVVEYIVTPSSTGGCAGSPFMIDVTIGAAPVAADSIQGPPIVCESSSVTYSVTPVPEATNYIWTLPTSFIITTTPLTTVSNGGFLSYPPSINVIIPIGVSTGNLISVEAKNDCGTSPSTSFSIAINPTPVANFTMVPDSTDGYSYWTYNSTQGTGITFNWDFNDGNSSTLVSPTHTFTIPASYNVCLYASSGTCSSNPVCHNITIIGPTPNSCLALFDATRNAFNSNAFTITNLSYGSNLTYSWDFGDGNTSTAQLPSHNYSGAGPYQVCLTVDNGAGCNQTYCDSLFAVDSLGHSVMQPISIVVVDGPSGTTVGINETYTNASIEVAPNPFNETTVFTIHSSKANQLYSFEMKDVLGKTVESIKGINEKQFTVSREDLSGGMYFYKIYSNEGVIGIGKVVIK